MTQPRHLLAAAALALALLAGAGCGDDDSTSTTSSGTPSAAQAASAMANLQLAASDVVRETSYEDEDGSQRAIETFDRLFETGRSTIESKGPELARRIEEESDAVGGAVARGDLAGASREAKALQTAVNAAAAAVTGKAAGTEQGLIAVLEQMKAAARDLNEEAKNDDARGTKRAYEAFSKLFESSRKQLTAENPGAVETIETGLGKVRAALDGEDDAAAIQATTGDLLTATNALEGEAK